MYYLDKLVSGAKEYYRRVNRANMSGAIDIVVIQQPDGTFKSTPFHVRFGKSGVLVPRSNLVEIRINDKVVNDLTMRIGSSGECFFDEPFDSQPHHSPIRPSSNIGTEDLFDKPMSIGEEDSKTETCDFGPSSPSDDSAESLSIQSPINTTCSDYEWNSTTSEDQESFDLLSRQMADHLRCTENWPKDFSILKMPGKWQRTAASSSTTKSFSDNNLELAEDNRGVPNVPWSPWSVKAAMEKGCVTKLNATDVEKLTDEDFPLLWTEWEGQLMSWKQAVNKLKQNFSQISPLRSSVDDGKVEDLQSPSQLPSWGSFPNLSEDEPDSYDIRSASSTDSGRNSPGNRRNAFSNSFMENDFACFSDGESKRKGLNETPAEGYRPPIGQRKILTSEELKSLHLNYGSNRAVFSVTTKYQGTCQCGCFIYLWEWTEKLVISDIDGTITKSDVRGQLMPLVGLEWVHNDVVSLYHKIAANGYRFLYLSSRSVGQARSTRGMLCSLEQNGHRLPDGPILLAPFSLWRAIHKEVVQRKADEFKIACLQQVCNLFPQEAYNSTSGQFPPLVAGFGNRATDIKTYKAVGLQGSHIFTVNRLGEVVCGNDESVLATGINRAAQASPLTYKSLTSMVNDYFPQRKVASFRS
ncbi:hypothetical protein CRM22_009529 [Opisthorchis felineus]|uniref:LNS2/PITP domain-containing protein n=1 Tax=Opisthorchis felineus TaxID=147828 RepID=A0A4S2L6M9_OPIFE|nr:hypothetical protein CRM22_009529 [Opisthorchis felineus]